MPHILCCETEFRRDLNPKPLGRKAKRDQHRRSRPTRLKYQWYIFSVEPTKDITRHHKKKTRSKARKEKPGPESGLESNLVPRHKKHRAAKKSAATRTLRFQRILRHHNNIKKQSSDKETIQLLSLQTELEEEVPSQLTAAAAASESTKKGLVPLKLWNPRWL